MALVLNDRGGDAVVGNTDDSPTVNCYKDYMQVQNPLIQITWRALSQSPVIKQDTTSHWWHNLLNMHQPMLGSAEPF